MRIPSLHAMNQPGPKAWAVGGTLVVLGLGALGMRMTSTGGMLPRAMFSPKILACDLNESAPAQGLREQAQSQLPAPTLKRIQKATVYLEVADLVKARQAVESLTGGVGGYVASSRSGDGNRNSGSVQMNLQIPSDRFDETLGALVRQGKVLSEQRSVEDITRAYVDLEARLRNKRVSQARIRDILATRTGKISDVVEAEQALAGVTEEIERMEAQRRVFDHEVAFGVLDLTLQVKPFVAVAPPWWTPLREGARVSVDALIASVMALAQLLAFLLPWGLLVSPLILWYRRKIRLQSQPQS